MPRSGHVHKNQISGKIIMQIDGVAQIYQQSIFDSVFNSPLNKNLIEFIKLI